MSNSRVSAVRRRLYATLDESYEITFLGGSILILCILFTLLNSVFFSWGNFINIIRHTTIVIVLGLGMTFAIISKEIDVSIGGIMAISGVAAALAINEFGAVAGVVVAMAVAIGFGVLNGLFTISWGIPSFIVTIGMLGVARGAAHIVSSNRPIVVRNELFESWFGGNVGPIPTMIVWAGILAVISAGILWKTRFGRHVYATGDSQQAAVYAGINTTRVKLLTLTLSGAGAGMAALLFIGRLGAARPTMGSGLELAVIAAVIIGGTSLFGGRGTIFGTIMGAMLIGVITNGLTIMGYGQSWQQVIQGLVIIAAVKLRTEDEETEWL